MLSMGKANHSLNKYQNVILIENTHKIFQNSNVETLPVFTRQLKDVRCCDGDGIRLECYVSAIPEPTIRWEKDGRKLIQTNDELSTSYDGECAILTIKRVYPEDEGEYKCIASNTIGQTISSACIIVDGKL